MRAGVVRCVLALVVGLPVGVWALTDTVQVWWTAHAFVREHYPAGSRIQESWVDPNDDQTAVGVDVPGDRDGHGVELSRSGNGWRVSGESVTT